jgi:hypothetical protein
MESEDIVQQLVNQAKREEDLIYVQNVTNISMQHQYKSLDERTVV